MKFIMCVLISVAMFSSIQSVFDGTNVLENAKNKIKIEEQVNK